MCIYYEQTGKFTQKFGEFDFKFGEFDYKFLHEETETSAGCGAWQRQAGAGICALDNRGEVSEIKNFGIISLFLILQGARLPSAVGITGLKESCWGLSHPKPPKILQNQVPELHCRT